jgi:histone-lysine N-methyltransferase SETMAR
MKETAYRALATQKELAYLGFQYLDHPPYSLDLAPSDYHLFPGLKKTIEREVGRAKDLSASLHQEFRVTE